jgi:hypothetical protein
VAKKDPEDEKLNPKQRNKKLCWCVKVISVAKYKKKIRDDMASYVWVCPKECEISIPIKKIVLYEE